MRAVLIPATAASWPIWAKVGLMAPVLMTKEARKPKLYEVQGILAEEAPVVVLWNADNNNAFRPAAYGGWIADPYHGIFTKRSFLPQYAGR